MILLDLEPHWLTEHVFAFKCPFCRKIWLTCKNIPMTIKEQRLLFEEKFGEEKWHRTVVPMETGCCWTFSGKDFGTLTVTPSIDASKAGCWHGNITNGQIVGGF